MAPHVSQAMAPEMRAQHHYHTQITEHSHFLGDYFDYLDKFEEQAKQLSQLSMHEPGP